MKARRRPPIQVSMADIHDRAETAFRITGYRGTDGGIFWRMAALLHTGKITEHEFFDSLEAASVCGRNKPAYVRSCLREHLLKRQEAVDANALLSRVWIVPYCPTAEDGSSPEYERKRRAEQFISKAKQTKARRTRKAAR